jgi:hypothetical protein
LDEEVSDKRDRGKKEREREGERKRTKRNETRAKGEKDGTKNERPRESSTSWLGHAGTLPRRGGEWRPVRRAARASYTGSAVPPS